jgi:hypothetical protein
MNLVVKGKSPKEKKKNTLYSNLEEKNVVI